MFDIYQLLTEMKKSALILILHLAFTSAWAQSKTETRNLQAFNHLKVSNRIEAEVVWGDQYTIQITTKDFSVENVETLLDNQTLEIKILGSHSSDSRVKAIITCPRLNGIEVNTSANVVVKGLLESKIVQLLVSTSGSLEVEVKAEELLLEAQTNGQMVVKGRAEKLDYNAFTNAEINGDELEVAHAQIRTNTNAYGTFTVLESIKGNAATF